jgi:hypothetical protein
MRFFAIILLTVAVLTGCSRQATLSSLAGSYYRGDGTGYNVNINLAANGTYKAVWHGCLGVYGTASGNWSVDGARIVLSPSSETDMLKGHLRELHIVKHNGQIVFVPDLHDDYYQKHGPDRYSAFHKQKR